MTAPARTCKLAEIVRPGQNEELTADLAAALAAVASGGGTVTSIAYCKNRHDLALANILYTKSVSFTDMADEYPITAFSSASGDTISYEAVNVHGATPDLQTALNERLLEIQKMTQIISGSGSTATYGYRGSVLGVTFVSDKVAMIQWENNADA